MRFHDTMVVCIVSFLVAVPCVSLGQDVVTVGIDGTGHAKMMQDIAKSWMAKLPGASVSLGFSSQLEGIPELCRAKYDVLFKTTPESDRDVAFLRWRFPQPGQQPRVVLLSQARVVVVVNKNSDIQHLSPPEIKDALRIGPVPVSTASHSIRNMQWAMPNEGGLCEGIVSRLCMTTTHSNYSGRPGYRTDIAWQDSDADVVSFVKKNANGIGLTLWPGKPIEGVRTLAIASSPEGPFVMPANSVVCQTGYPLAESLYMYRHPDTMALSEAFCAFALGAEAAKIAEEYGLITPWHEFNYLSGQRLAAMKSGKGARISAMVAVAGQGALSDLAGAYVAAKEVIQLAPVAGDVDVSLMGVFLGAGGNEMVSSQPAFRGRELLLLADKPSARAMEVHGAKWNALGVGKDGGSAGLTAGKPNGTGPAEYVLAGRAVGVVVNAANKLDSLTLGQIQAIFNGSVDDWAVIGSTGLTTGGSTGLTAGGSTGLRPDGTTPRQAGLAAGGARGEIRINCFGLRSSEPAAGVFHKEGVAADKLQRVTAKKDTAEVLAAVGSDPSAIGFVDLAAMGVGASVTGERSTAGNVKVLAIKIGTGDSAKLVAPTPENIKNALYPLSQRLYLYVHPQASDTAKDFAKFIATCGASEATPYADVVKSVMEAYGKNGLFPLADAALERMAKDALAEAQAAAKEEAAKTKKGGKKKS